MQKPSERHKLTSDNNIIKFKKPVHDPYKYIITKRRYLKKKDLDLWQFQHSIY